MIQTYPINHDAPRVKINVRGDLQIEGRERKDIQAVFDRVEDLQVSEISSGLYFDCRDDLDLEVPRHVKIEIVLAGGDARVSDVLGGIKISQVGGDLEVTGCGTTSVDRVEGDLEVLEIRGDLAVSRTGGDVDIADVSGAVALNRAGGDLDIKDVQGSLAVNSSDGDMSLKRTGETAIGLVGGDLECSVIRGSLAIRRVGGDADLDDLQGSLSVDTVGGDLTLNGRSLFRASIGGDADIELEETPPGESRLNAGGDIALSLPPNTQSRLEIASGGGSISLDLAGEEQEIRSMLYQATFGSGSSRIVLRAGGDVEVESPEKAATSSDVNQGFDFSQAGHKFTREEKEKIEEQVLASTRHVAEQIEEARQRLEKRGIFIPGLTRNPPQPVEQEISTEPVGEDERLIILRMLQDKRITIEEAEQLLEALDAQDLNATE